MSTDAKADVVAAQQSLVDAGQHLTDAVAKMHDPPAVLITTPAQLDAALAAALPGAVLTLAATLVYPGPLTLRTPLTLQSETHEARQGIIMAIDEPAPRFLAGVTVPGDDVRLLSLDYRHTNPLTTIVTISGTRVVLDRPRVLGDPVKGGRRGIDFRGCTLAELRHFLIDDIFSATTDTQAFYSETMGPGGGLIVDHGVGCAAGMGFMFGGGDAPSAATIPSNIRITRSRFTKKLAWMAPRDPVLIPGRHVMQAKCAIEFKDAINVVVDDCDLEGAGTSDGQQGYLVDATVRNQTGKAPWQVVKNIVISNCRGRLAAGICNILGSDNNFPSGTLDGLTIRDFTATDMDPKGPSGGRGWLFQFDRAPRNVVLDGISVAGQNLQAVATFAGPPPIGFVAKRFTVPPTKYGWKVEGTPPAPDGSGITVLRAYMPDAQFDETIR
jgi:hypothetical protein